MRQAILPLVGDVISKHMVEDIIFLLWNILNFVVKITQDSIKWISYNSLVPSFEGFASVQTSGQWRPKSNLPSKQHSLVFEISK